MHASRAECARIAAAQVVGDPDQCIYTFSGSCAANVATFQAAYPAAAVVRLAHNFRSTAAICDAAAALIAELPAMTWPS